jgi:hypothetical protein
LPRLLAFMLFQVLWRNQPIWQILGSIFGTFLGITLLILAWQTHQSFQQYLEKQDELFPSKYLTVSKSVSLLSNLPGMKPQFSEEEVETLRKTPGVKELATYAAAEFRTEAIIKIGMGQAYQTELFLESVPTHFLENPPENWDWSPDSPFLPALLPNSFLQLYNFGFAPANGYPQISKSMMAKVPITLAMKWKNGTTRQVSARIIAFSDRITSVLVPEAFLEWANAQQPQSPKNKPIHRVLLLAETPITPQLTTELEKYETNQELLKDGEAHHLLQFAIKTTSVLGLALFLMALLAYWLSFQVVMYRSNQHLQTLLHIGYPPCTLLWHYIRILLGIGFMLCIFSTFAVIQIQEFTSEFSQQMGLELTTPGWIVTLSQVTVPIIGIILVQILFIRTNLQKLASS